LLVEREDLRNGEKENTRSQSTRGPSEKKNEKATINMVMVVTTNSKALEEVAHQDKEPLNGKDPKISKKRRSSSN
jgi:hypothetical protein